MSFLVFVDWMYRKHVIVDHFLVCTVSSLPIDPSLISFSMLDIWTVPDHWHYSQTLLEHRLIPLVYAMHTTPIGHGSTDVKFE